MALSDPLFTSEALRNLAKDNGPEYAGRSRRALRWCADVIEAANDVVQESTEVRKDDEALIRQLVAAVQTGFDQTCSVGRQKDWTQLSEALAAARARLGKAP